MYKVRVKLTDRFLALLLAVLMIFAMIPFTTLQTFAAEKVAGVLTTNIGEQPFMVNKATEFTFTTTANDDANKMVRGSFVFSDPDAIEKLEYLETDNGMWYEFYGEFGPESGFPMIDGTSTFRVTFNKEGNYTVTAYMKSVEDGSELCSTNADVVVKRNGSSLSTNIGEKTFEVGNSTEFTFTTTANADANVMVRGAFVFSDPDAIEKLEYLETDNGMWYEFSGEFGPESGFPMIDGTSTFRATFKKAGNYYLTASMKTVSDGTVLCTTTANVNVVKNVKVTAVSNTGGSVSLNGDSSGALNVIAGSNVNLDITSNEGYQISSVAINGSYCTLDNEITFSKTITVTDDTEISVVFVKTYTIVITHNSNGTVVTEPANAGGSVTVVEDSSFKITADPDDNYRISEVKINEVTDETITGANFGPEDKYTKELTANKDYTIVITFAPNRYKVTVGETTNGSVSIESDFVDYNGTTKVTITPDDGYTIDFAEVNGVIVDIDDYIVPDDTLTYFLINNIVEDQNVEVAFKKTSYANMADVSFNNEDDLRNNLAAPLYVFTNDATVTFSTNKSGVMVIDTKNNIVSGAYNSNTASIFNTTSIGTISLYYKAENDCVPAWHMVADVTNNNPLYIVFDDEKAELSVEPESPNDYGYYNSDVSVSISAEDKGNYSGIGSVEYWITNNGTETIRETLYTYKSGEGIKNTYNANIIVDSINNNSDDVVVNVKIVDRAGNAKTESKTLKINSTPPSVSVLIDGTLHSEAAVGKYNKVRTATVTYIDRSTTFNEAAAMEGITISAKNANGRDVIISKPAMITWNHSGDTHTATISFSVDANYEWGISYKNNAELSDEKIETTGDSVYEFAVDTEAPINEEIVLDSRPFETLISFLTFGIFKNYEVTAEATASDRTTDVYDILYFKSNETEALSEEQLEQAFTDDKFTKDKITIRADERFAVYARITDFAGNTKYISTNGVVYDKTKSSINFVAPDANANGYYNSDVVIPFSVSDVKNADTAYSGIKSITYYVENDGQKTQEGTLYTFDIENPTYDQLVPEWNSADNDKNIIVDSKKNNSDNVRVTVKVIDNADNEYEESVALAINIDKPTSTIDFTDTANKVVDGYGYYGDVRTATITIVDRATSFDKEAATKGITFTAVDANGETVDLSGDDVVISDWKSSGNQHTATVTFNKDGNYTWSFEYTNKADNEMVNISADDAYSPYSFTVDKTKPAGTISVNINTWDKLLNVLTFGLYSNVKAEVSATADDETSPYIVEYFETNNPVAMSGDELDKETFKPYEDYIIENDKQFVIYLKITDYAGNYIYVSSDGYTVDKVASIITLTPSEANSFYDKNANADGQYGIYNIASEITVDIKVEDTEPYSGIKTVEYWVENNNVKTQEGNLFTFDISEPAQKDLVKEWTGSITVDKVLNNSCNVVVYIKTVDNAGNSNIRSVRLDIDNTNPVIDVKFDNNKDNNGNTYFDAQRTATVVITERNHHFDATAATAGIVINAVDAKGNPVENAYTISAWKTADNAEKPDTATHTATIFFEKDANYTWSVAYSDKADNSNDGVNLAEGTVAAFDFTVDTTAPTGTVKATSAEGRETKWDSLRNTLTFGFWSKEAITVSGTSDDATSAPIASVEYYKVTATAANDGTTPLTEEELDKVTTWTEFDGLEITSDEQFTVYIKITDLAGNYTYISTNGLIVDHTAPMEETIAPEITVEPQQPINGLYNADVKVDIKVVDPLTGGTYSGLKTVSYKVFNMGTETQSGTLYAFDNADPKQNELLQMWTGEITVDSKLNNSNDVVIEIYAEDNSLNSSDDDVEIKIDITAPVFDITYDNNSADNSKYFKNNRTATIVVTERNFNAEDVNVVITNTDGAIPTTGEWTRTEGTGNLDNTKWTTLITYSADGDYTFDISYTDLADNKCSGIQYGNSVAPTEFTVDKTLPVVTVSYSNNSARNDKYFDAPRTATIVITEHNFDVNRVVFSQTAALNGANITIPAASWVDNGDVHTATIVYNNDGDYTFDVAVKDMAANDSEEAAYGDSVAGKDFVVDQTIEKPSINGITNGSAYKGDVIPAITFNDVNYDSYEVKLVQTRMGEKNVDVTEKFIKGIAEQTQGGSGAFDTFEKIVENDGIYTLTVKMTDKAGNEASEEYTFTVNRFGSAYEYSDELVSLIKDGGQYIKSVDKDLVITEYNADRLLAGSLKLLITRDGETVDADFTSNPADINTQVGIGESGWYQYVYTIKASNFDKDGVYKISLASKYSTVDSPENDSTSVPENSLDKKGKKITDTISFTVDSVAPEIRNIVNLDKAIADIDKITEDGKLNIKYTIVDVGGLKTIEIIVNGKTVQTLSAKEIAENAYNYTGSFYLEEQDGTIAHNVQIKVTDLAGNVTDTNSEEFLKLHSEDNKDSTYVFFNEVTVSRSFLVRWYANTALFWGSVAGVIVLAAAVCFLIAARKKKNN